MKVLIAEDNAGIRTVIEGLLKAWGFDSVSARDGAEAWQILQGEDPPQLVILDWMMPEMDGLEICRRLKEYPPTKPTYKIFLTCCDNTQDIVAGLQAGADDYITKPFEAEELRARIQVGQRVLDLQDSLQSRVVDLSRAGEELQKVNRALRVLYAAGQILVKADTEQVLLTDICRLIVETGGYRLAWVGFMDGNLGGHVRPVVHAGASDIPRLNWSEQSGERRSVHLIASSQPAISKNVAADPFFAPVTGTESAGYAAVISLPLKFDGKVFGELRIYATTADAFDDEEARLLGRLASDLAYGIVAQRTAAERRRAEKELQMERDRAQLYLDEAGVLLMVLDADGLISQVNRKGCDILGYGEQELIGKNWFMNYLYPESRGDARQLFNDLLRGAGNQEEPFVQKVVSRSGEERVLEIHNSLIRDQAGGVAGVLFSGADITERQKAEAALRESEESYRVLFDRFVTSSSGISSYKAHRP